MALRTMTRTKERQIKLPGWMDYEPPYANKGPLFRMRNKVAYMNLEGRVFKNTSKSSWGTYGDVFAGNYIPADGIPRLVAVKELRVHIMKEKDVQGRLAKELYIWSKLDHPNILPFYGFYIEDDIRLHLVSPWMSNGTILSYLESNCMADVLLSVKQTAEGIRYLHENGIIHSDIKPDNILISDFGKAQLCDFGLSRILEASMTFQASTTSMARGTLRYMAKEVILAEGGETYSKQADVWAFGMTAYTIVTRRHPYHDFKSDATVMRQICNDKLPSWPDEDEVWSPARRILKKICEQCWLGESERSSMEDVVLTLTDCCLRACLQCLNTMDTQLKLNLYNIESSYSLNGNILGPKDHVTGSVEFACLNWVDYALQTVDVSTLCGSVADFFSSSGPLYWIEILSLFGELESGKAKLQEIIDHFKDEDRIVNLATGWLMFISDFYDAISVSAPHVYISALAWGVPNAVRRIGEKRFLVSVDYSIPNPPVVNASELERGLQRTFRTSFSTDGSTFASGHMDGHLRIWDVVTGKLIRDVEAHYTIVYDVKFSPDDCKIATGSTDNTLRIWDARTGDLVVRPLRGHTSWVGSVAYSPDGKSIASGSDDMALRVWDAQTGASIWGPLIGHDDAVAVVSYSPDGKEIVSGSEDDTMQIWDARTGEQVGEPLVGHHDSVICLEYSLDGRRIVSGSRDRTVRIWDAVTKGPIGKPLEGHQDAVWSVAYTPDGSRIVSGSSDGTLRIWDARTGSPIGVIPRSESRWDSDRECFLSVPIWWPGCAEPTPKALLHSDAPIQVPKSGWLRTLNGDLFLWVPPKYRVDICCRGPLGKIPPRLKFDWKKVPHGENWTRVKEILKEPFGQ